MKNYQSVTNRKALEMTSLRTNLNQVLTLRTTKVLVLALLGFGLQIVATPANAADCNKGTVTQQATCTAVEESKTSDPLKTVSDSSAQTQKTAGQVAQSTKVKSRSTVVKHEKERVWTPTVATTCIRGQITLKLSKATDSCPKGFTKK